MEQSDKNLDGLSIDQLEALTIAVDIATHWLAEKGTDGAPTFVAKRYGDLLDNMSTLKWKIEWAVTRRENEIASRALAPVAGEH